MKDTLFIGGLCAVIVLVGAGLYFFEPERAPVGEIPIMPLAEGQYALGVSEEKNFRIRSEEELNEIWTRIHGNERPALPRVDFSDSEVLAVFDGSHATGGYSIRVVEVVDAELIRTVYIEHREPAENCMVPSVMTSPYQLVVVPKMREALRLTHADVDATTPCP